MLSTLLTICLALVAGALGALLGLKGVNAAWKRELQTTRDDLDHLAGRFERELKVRAANRSVEARVGNLKEAELIAAQAKARQPEQFKLWGRAAREN